MTQPLLLGRALSNSPMNNNRNLSGGSRGVNRLAIPEGDVFTVRSKSHLMTIAPSRTDRCDSSIIPNLLMYPGSVVVTDPKGQAYTATAETRRKMGHTVIRLDPFRVIVEDSDALNPLDLVVGLEKGNMASASQDIADLLPLRNSFADPWSNSIFGLISGVIGYLACVPEKQKFADLYSIFHSDDVIYNLAVVLDTIGGKIPPMAYAEIASFLQKEDAQRTRILTAVCSHLKAIASQEVQKAFGKSSVPLDEIIEGKPVTVYIIVPPEKLPAHFSLLRVWIGTLLLCANRQTANAPHPMLFLLDECGLIGSFPQLETAITACEEYGFRIWTFWDDLSQLRSVYPVGWATMVNNCGTVQLFGIKNYAPACEAAALLGIDPEEIRCLASDEQIVCCDGIPFKINKFDYLSDPLFANRSKS